MALSGVTLRHGSRMGFILSLRRTTIVLFTTICSLVILSGESAASSKEDRTKQLSVQIVNATSLTLSWTAPKGDQVACPMQRYIVRLRQEGQKQSRAWRLDADRQSVTLHDLHPSTGYQVRLMSITCEGKRRSSRWVSLTTADLAPTSGDKPASLTERQAPGPPSQVRTRTSHDSVVVTWYPPEESALVRGYMIGYGEGVPDVNWRYVSLTQREVTIYGLKPSTQYVISVRALNNFGKGQVVYDIVNTKAAPTAASSGGLPSPVQLRSQILSPSTVLLQWADTSLDQNQKITDERYYNVYYQALQPATKNLSVIVKALHVTLYDLIPGRLYQFKVRTVKGSQTSPFSDSIVNKTDMFGTGEKSLGEELTGPDDDDYDYDADIRNVGDSGGGLRRSAGSGYTGRNGVQAEVKKKRAHNVVHESLARTLLMPQANESTAHGQAVNPDGSPQARLAFRAMVHYRVSAYVTWPEKPEPCVSTKGDQASVIGYVFRYKTVDDLGEHVARNIGTNFVLLDNLVPNSKYKYQVRYTMDRGSQSDWSQEAMLDTTYYPPNG